MVSISVSQPQLRFYNKEGSTVLAVGRDVVGGGGLSCLRQGWSETSPPRPMPPLKPPLPYSPLLRADLDGVVLVEDVEPLPGVHAVPLVV